ncbi:EamA family transporter [Paenibacillus ehimensis]|uniref:EamA family transporter n=1 Tax=Paenibacillus ehimensis TaxID=79264 RepID=UPI002DB8E8BE|nr:EamA family transporter [Paenibacillus ehimensis]MEC0213245.1 EamA family transporter [Paenibacillus ehimensis]
MSSYILLAANIFLLVSGQILFKLGLQKIGEFQILKILMSPFIISGLALYVVATGLWFVVLTKMNLSVAYPLQSLAYVLGLFAAWIVFGEFITVTKWIGVAAIIFGAYMIAK